MIKNLLKIIEDILENFILKSISKQLFLLMLCLFQKNVLRGLHLQQSNPQAKLITVLSGKVFDVCVDCRKNSKTFGKYYSIILSDKNNKSLLIPAGFAHGFYTLANRTILHYKCSKYRHAKSETGIIWNDKDLKIKWPTRKIIISKKDNNNISFRDFKKLI